MTSKETIEELKGTIATAGRKIIEEMVVKVYDVTPEVSEIRWGSPYDCLLAKLEGDDDYTLLANMPPETAAKLKVLDQHLSMIGEGMKHIYGTGTEVYATKEKVFAI